MAYQILWAVLKMHFTVFLIALVLFSQASGKFLILTLHTNLITDQQKCTFYNIIFHLYKHLCTVTAFHDAITIKLYFASLLVQILKYVNKEQDREQKRISFIRDASEEGRLLAMYR